MVENHQKSVMTHDLEGMSHFERYICHDFERYVTLLKGYVTFRGGYVTLRRVCHTKKGMSH